MTNPDRTLTRAVLIGLVAICGALAPPAPSRGQPADATLPLEGSSPPGVTALPRRGGHSRPGFDDIEVLRPTELPFREIVSPSRFVPGSLSMGTTADGWLVASARVPAEGEHHYILQEHRERPSHYGTEEMVSLLLDTARRANQADPSIRLAIGNLSLEDGGDSPWSRSHNSGRDADVAFLMEDAAGDPVELTTMITVDRRGRARDGSGLHFDVERTWTLVASLLQSEAAQIQWLFIYDPLRTMLLDHARAIGTDDELLTRAERVLKQPSDSSRHDDHLHVRIYCSREDRLEGCVHWGPEWPHIDMYEGELAARVDELVRGLMTAEDPVALACVDFLDRLQPRRHAARIAAALPYQAPAVQLATLDLLEELDQLGVSGPILPLAESSPDDAVRARAFEVLGRLADPAGTRWLADVAVRDGRPLSDGRSVRELALDALRFTPDPALLPAAIALVGDLRPEVRAAADVVLRRTTLETPPPSLFEPAAIAGFWKRWYSENAAAGRDAWIVARFRREGLPIGDFRRTPPWEELVEALDKPDEHLQFVADRLLAELSGTWSPLDGWSTSRRLRFWRDEVL